MYRSTTIGYKSGYGIRHDGQSVDKDKTTEKLFSSVTLFTQPALIKLKVMMYLTGANLVSLVLLATYLLTAVVQSEAKATSYYVEVKVVVDEPAVKRWQKASGKDLNALKIELNSMFGEVNELYKSLDEMMVIRFGIKELILNAKNVVEDNDGHVGWKKLDDFEKWLNKTQPYKRKNYDIAVWLTGHEVSYDGYEGVNYLGWGEIKAVCTSNAVAMLEFHGTYTDVVVLAHELAHVMGARHDGIQNNDMTKGCKPGYIMGGAISRKITKKTFQFSYCSYVQFEDNLKNHLKKNAWECLSDGDVSKAAKGPRLGSVVSPDDICKREFGEHSFLDRKQYMKRSYPYVEGVCKTIMCANKKKKSLRYNVQMPEGTNCGKNKQCIKGECIVTGDGSDKVQDVCPFGDAPEIDHKVHKNHYKTCADLPLTECSKMRYECCQRCNLAMMNKPDEYCRKIHGPDSAVARDYYNAINYGKYGDYFCQILMCKVGFYQPTSQTQIRTAYTPDGMPCGKNKVCKNKKCVRSPEGIAHMSDHCPYGDQPWVSNGYRNCYDIVPTRGCKQIWRRRCCGSCPYR